MIKKFRFLGNVALDGFIRFTEETAPLWKKKCSAVDVWKPHPKDDYERDLHHYYNEYNSTYYTYDLHSVSDELLLVAKIKPCEYKAYIISSLPGNMEPMHIDQYGSLLGRLEALGSAEEKLNSIRRVWVPLEDSNMGQILFTPEDAIIQWSAGDVYEVPNGVYHGFVNAGNKQRHTLVLTGFVND